MKKFYQALELFSYLLPRMGILLRPRVIQFPVNDICNAGCQMCSIWKNKLGYQISPEELDHILKSKLFNKVQVVGINGGEPTLRKDLGLIVDTLFRNLPKLQQISLITNGLVYKKVMIGINAISEAVRKNNGKLNIMVSLDGVGQTHDLVRGREGNFENVMKVLDDIKDQEPADSLQIGCTVIKQNIYGLHDLHDLAIEKDIYIKYRIGIPHQRLYTDNIVEPFSLSLEEKFHFCNFLEGIIKHYEQSERQRYFYRSLINQVLYKLPRKAGCDWQFRGATITADSKLLYCAVKSPTLGNLLEQNPYSIYKNHKSSLQEIIKNDCDECMHDYVGPLPFPAFFVQRIKTTGNFLVSLTGKYISSFLTRETKRLRYYLRLSRFRKLGRKKNDILQAKNTLATKILICGWYGTETMGDQAIVAGIIQEIKQRVDNPDIYIASLNPIISELSRKQVPELKYTTTIDLYNEVIPANEFHLIIFGGGPLMALNNLAEMTRLSDSAQSCNVPFLICGCGVGPLGEGFYNRSICKILNNASHRIFRDRQSLDTAHSLSVTAATDYVAEDPAFTWAANTLPALTRAKKNSDVLTIALGLRDWPYTEYARHIEASEAEQQKSAFEDSVLSVLEALCKIRKVRIIPVSMCTNHIGSDDRWYYRYLLRKKPELLPFIERGLLTRTIGPKEGLQVFRNADIAITMRYHALVFAIACQTPTIALDYTLGKGKVASLASKYDIACFPVNKISTNVLLAAINNILDSVSEKPDISANHGLQFQHAFRQAMEAIL